MARKTRSTNSKVSARIAAMKAQAEQKLKAFWCEGTGPYASAFAVVLAGDKVEACDLAKVHHRADFFGISFHPDAVEEMPLLPLNGMSAKILVWGDHADC